jgi:hypothetical protein
MKNSRDIDFVILWVDHNDTIWQREFIRYRGDRESISSFRDWGHLRYIFRSFEEFAPWVRKIHLVTSGQIPKWIDIDHPKLNLIHHKDLLDIDTLPTFNSNAIEPYIYKIDGLAEHFVLFNDDTILTKAIQRERFFKDGLPRDIMISNALSSSSGVGHFVLNNIEILNRHFNKRDICFSNFSKCFNYRYGIDLLRNIALLPWGRFTGFIDPHQPQPFLKSTFHELWRVENEEISSRTISKFRSCSNINIYLFRYWQLAKGEFSPISMSDTEFIILDSIETIDQKLSDMILSNRYSMICLNDSTLLQEREFIEAKTKLDQILYKLLPNRSTFELET